MVGFVRRRNENSCSGWDRRELKKMVAERGAPEALCRLRLLRAAMRGTEKGRSREFRKAWCRRSTLRQRGELTSRQPSVCSLAWQSADSVYGNHNLIINIARLLFPSLGRSTATKCTRSKEQTTSSNQPDHTRNNERKLTPGRPSWHRLYERDYEAFPLMVSHKRV